MDKYSVRKIHRWLGFVVGLQFLAWTSGGFVMSFFELDNVRGEREMVEVEAQPISSSAEVTSVPEILTILRQRAPQTEVVAVKLHHNLFGLVYEALLMPGEECVMLDAMSGKILSPVSEQQALLAARADFTGKAATLAVQWLTETNLEYRGRVPVYRVDFDNEKKTHLYISPEDGRVLARRNKIWRLYDFFWMLHIMDYQERENFNHPWLYTLAAVAIALALSGITLLGVHLQRQWQEQRRSRRPVPASPIFRTSRAGKSLRARRRASGGWSSYTADGTTLSLLLFVS